ncbi:hypothetical protein GCM10009798_32550 [Nocardioides panacihumi]|uniref:Glycosyltransferase n=1 Tax=Nocardioides panacihumi TaxID=400774 RepID=A0ABN2RJ21_9ACTN
MPRALLLTMQDLGAWRAKADDGERPGGALPYGLDELSGDFDLVWDESYRHHRATAYAARAIDRGARAAAPGLQGLVPAANGVRVRPRPDVALSVFENIGLGYARVQAVLPRDRRVAHVMMVCWLAEDATTMSGGQRRSVARSLRGASRIVVFSSNQVAALADLGADQERIDVVPFGVDADYYSPSRVASPPGGRGLVAVGSDSRRDYATLFAAAELAHVPVAVLCQPRNVEGLRPPPEVTLLHDVYDADYRRLLHEADLVVTTTTAPAYPSGQSVVLEAMAMGRATLTTDSPAMREYVHDGVTGVLSPPGDAPVLARHMTELLAAADRRESLGRAAGEDVRRRFTHRLMWRGVADVMRAATVREGR